MKAIVCSLLILCSAPTFADERVVDAQIAMEMARAGQIEEAISRYEILLNQGLSDQQRALIQYNLGTLYMAKGRWQKALEQFQAINPAHYPSLQFTQRLKWNSALALLNYVVAAEKMNFPDDLREEYALRALSQLLQQALKEAEFAHDAEGIALKMRIEAENAKIQKRLAAFEEDKEQDSFDVATATPEQILKQLLRAQREAVRAADDDLAAQKEIQKIASAFLERVAATQESGYAQGICQEQPWASALPLFFKGENASSQAVENPNPSSFRENQFLAYHYWQRALQALQQKPEHQQQAPTQPLDVQQLNNEEVLRLLQQSELEDQGEVQPSNVTPGNRPW